MKKLIDEIINVLARMTDEQLLSTHDSIINLLKSTPETKTDTICPYCGGKTVKNGKQCGKQRHQCKECGCTFTYTVNTVMYRSRAGERIWNEVISDTLNFVSIDETAERLRLSHDRVFHMRHKILAALENMEANCPDKLSNVSECDETFVLESLKGSKMPDGYWRKSRKHGAKAQKRGISNEYICICTGVGREGGAVAATANRAKPDASELKFVFNGYLDSGILVLCDGLKTYGTLSGVYGCSVKDVNNETDRFYHLNVSV